MPRHNLAVPYAERAEAKGLGARWDGKAKVWFVPDGKDHTNFARWLKAPQRTNVRAPRYFIARSLHRCWKCERETVVHGFALTPPYQILVSLKTDDADAHHVWRDAERGAWLAYVRALPNSVETRLSLVAPLTKAATTTTVKKPYFLNHCEHCRAKLADFATVKEFNAPLNPVYLTDIAKVTLFLVDEEFEARADVHSHGNIDAVALARKLPFQEALSSTND